MTTAVRIRCSRSEDIPDAAEIASKVDRDHHVVLHLEGQPVQAKKAAVIKELAQQLPDYSVFNSGGDRVSEWVSIVRVVGKDAVIQRKDDFRAAIRDYQTTCDQLAMQYAAGLLDPSWSAKEHGEHCRFENEKTGQVVEAPIEDALRGTIDPYFFWEFVETTSGHSAVSKLISGGFHDAARALDILEGVGPESGLDAQQSAGADSDETKRRG